LTEEMGNNPLMIITALKTIQFDPIL